MAMGLNQIAGVGGGLIGLILGGILADIDWRLVFLVSVPIGLLGTIWGYLTLKEQSVPDKTQKIDWLGNATFAIGLTALLAERVPCHRARRRCARSRASPCFRQ